MRLSKQINSGGYYAFLGKSNANSCFIERLSDAKQFLVYANYFLRGYLTIHDYIINRDGWILIVKIHSKKQILGINNESDNPKEIWKIISERMRLFLSTFVRITNRRKGRTGCLVHSRYTKLVFENLGEALEMIEKIRTKQIRLYTGKKKYRGLKTHYRIGKNLGNGSIFLCSRDLRRKNERGVELGEVFDFNRLSKLVVQNYVINTLKIQPTPTKPTKPPFFSKFQT